MPRFTPGVTPLQTIDEGCQRRREGSWHRDWTVQEKREYLTALSGKIWDMEEELAQWKAKKFEVMNSLQADLRSPRNCGIQATPRSLQRA